MGWKVMDRIVNTFINLRVPLDAVVGSLRA